MKITQWLFLLVLVFVVSGDYSFLSGLQSDVYHGRIVDEQTSQPLFAPYSLLYSLMTNTLGKDD
jgi:hypothetical protein